MKEEEKELSEREVKNRIIMAILEFKEDQDFMDEINQLSFPFSGKFKRYKQSNK